MKVGLDCLKSIILLCEKQYIHFIYVLRCCLFSCLRNFKAVYGGGEKGKVVSLNSLYVVCVLMLFLILLRPIIRNNGNNCNTLL